MSYESITNRIKQLEHLHQNLDNKIDAMTKNHPGVDETVVQEMKKQRLLYRDELSRLRRELYERSQTVNFDNDY